MTRDVGDHGDSAVPVFRCPDFLIPRCPDAYPLPVHPTASQIGVT